MIPATKSDAVLLAHIRECIDRIQEYTGGTRARFFEASLVRDAVVRNLQILAESTQRLSDPLKATEPDILWSSIAGFRNVLAHGYLSLDLDSVWSVVERDLPELDEAIERMAKRVIRPSD